jgi:Family of unknown function (DUF6807)
MTNSSFSRTWMPVAIATAGLLGALARPAPGQVVLETHLDQARVDVRVDGQPFTAYIWPKELTKPVLFPIRTAHGTPVTRGFPLEPRPGERVDHPHQVGFWLTYGDVNGVDFWNNSKALPPEQSARMGTIRQVAVKAAEGGEDRGRLEVRADWLVPGAHRVLAEATTFVFGGDASSRTIDRVTTLTADERVVFADNKEGMLGMRVARALEMPSTEPLVFTDKSGKPTAVPALDNTGVSGLYHSSEGLEGDAVWGTRARWVALAGRVGNEDVVLLLLDHPKNPGYPTYWHARGYGLFAANPLGQKIFSNGREELRFALEPGASTTFRYRLLVLSAPFSAPRAEAAWKAFVAEHAD